MLVAATKALANYSLLYELRTRHWSAAMEELEYLAGIPDVRIVTIVRKSFRFALCKKGVYYISVYKA